MKSAFYKAGRSAALFACVFYFDLSSFDPAFAGDVSPLPADNNDVGLDISSYFENWANRVKETQADQPSWAAPLNTVTPLLKEFVQYGQAFQTLPNGVNTYLYNGGRGGRNPSHPGLLQ